MSNVFDVLIYPFPGGAGGKAGSDNRELYLGSLYSTEHQKVFGYVTNTKIKLVIVVDNTNTTLRDNEIRSDLPVISLTVTLDSGL